MTSNGGFGLFFRIEQCLSTTVQISGRTYMSGSQVNVQIVFQRQHIASEIQASDCKYDPVVLYKNTRRIQCVLLRRGSQ